MRKRYEPGPRFVYAASSAAAGWLEARSKPAGRYRYSARLGIDRLSPVKLKLTRRVERERCSAFIDATDCPSADTSSTSTIKGGGSPANTDGSATAMPPSNESQIRPKPSAWTVRYRLTAFV